MNDKTDDHEAMRDQQIALQVEQALLIAGHTAALRGIAVEASAGSVVLSGRLPSYYLKQLAQVNAMNVDGVMQVRNRIRVRRVRSF